MLTFQAAFCYKPRVRRALLVVVLLALPMVSGCSLADWMFAAFGDAYSGGGPSEDDRYRDFDSRVEASQNAAAYGTVP